jgi:Outer membrane protein beta-barrel domain
LSGRWIPLWWRGAGVLVLCVAAAPATAGEKQIRPFVGVTFDGSTTFVDNENAVGKSHGLIGVSGIWLGEIVGVEADLAHVPGFFQAGGRGLVLDSRVTTLMGNVVVAAPARKTQYGLRPYFVGGAGLMWIHVNSTFGVFPLAETFAAVDIGGGVHGFLTNRVGVGWDVRRISSISKAEESGISFGRKDVSFWRASMALVIRY